MSFTSQTQMGKSPFQTLDAVSALKELSDESAATCSGGASITLYDGEYFGGEKTVRTGSDPDLKNGPFIGWNDRVSSVKVDGVWDLYPGAYFTDPQGGSKKIRVTTGSYNINQLKALGMDNNTVSSIKKL